MKWSKFLPILEQEPWLHFVIDSTSQGNLKKLQKHVERKVRHVAFRPFSRLNPNWSGQIAFSGVKTQEEGKGTTDQYLEWSDNLTHGIGYSILFHFLSENQPRLIPVGGPEKNTILEALQHMNRVLAEHGQGHGRHHLDMVVRSMWTTSQKYGLLYNSFDLFRFPEGFRLTQNGWSTLTRVK